MKKNKTFKRLFILISLVFTFFGCVPEVIVDFPQVAIISCDEIDKTSVRVNAQIISDGYSQILDQGIEIDNHKIPYSGNLGDKVFSVTLSELEPNTDYEVRSYATNALGTAYSDYFKFSTLDYDRFLIPGARIKNLASDQSGNIYIFGTFSEQKSGFVAKFQESGKIAWLRNVSSDTESYSYANGEIAVSGDVVYFHVVRNDTYGLGSGDIYLDAYNTSSGDLNWSVKVREDQGAGANLKIDQADNIWSIMGSTVALVSKEGFVLKHLSLGMGVSSLVFLEDDLLFAGSINGGATLKKFDQDFNLIFSKTFATDKTSSIKDLLYFEETKLLVLAKFSGTVSGISDGSNPEVDLSAYSLSGDNLNLKWKIAFNTVAYSIAIKQFDEESFYLSSDNAVNPIGPAKVLLNGDIFQSANPKNGRIAISASKIFLADGSERLTIY